MSRIKFIVLNVVGGACGVLILCDVVLAQGNGRLTQSVMTTRNQFGKAQQVQTTAQKLLLRVDQAGQTAPVLRDLLAKHEFKINQNTNSQTRPSP